MKKMGKKHIFLMAISIFFIQTIILGYNHKPPRLTVVLVIDQFAHSDLDKLTPFLKYGLRFFLDRGVVFTNAYQPAGQPGTATGHASLSTGTCAKDHGFVSNSWYVNGKKIACDDDSSGNALVLSPDGMYDYGKSSHMLMVDTLSDQCVLHTEPRSAFTSYSISGKSRSAIATSGVLGKPLWIDDQTGLFTSSKAYFDELPSWVNRFNKINDPRMRKTVRWERMYPRSPYAYDFFNINRYEFTRPGQTMLDRALPVFDESNAKNPLHVFERTPFANKLILDCALDCIKTHVSRKHKDRLMLWVCLSPLDKLRHEYGSSLESIDMIYHLDKQLQQFIRGVYRTIGKHEVAFALTSDHGIMPIPELLHEQGLTQARRIEKLEFIQRINAMLKEKHGVDAVVIAHKGQELVVDSTVMGKHDKAKQDAILADIQHYAQQEVGVKKVWNSHELSRMPTHPHTVEENMKNQIFEGRTGPLIIQTYPYSVITHWPQGASHKTPYDYDTHVPLIVFHPGRFERSVVRQRVVVQQLAPTLAELLNIQKPSASTYEILPGLFDPEYR